MKTPDITSTNQQLNNMRERVRLYMIVTGIVTAIICSLALLYEARATENYGNVNRLIEITKVVATDFSVEVVNRAVVTAVWPF